MFSKPQEEHRWLEQLVGKWKYETECVMGPDQPPMKSDGPVVGRSMGGIWVVLEFGGESPEHGAWDSLMTLGFDPANGKFTGTFVTSMMTHLWIYSGALDAGRRKLVLDATGPRFDQNGMAHYQDMIEIVDKDHWVLSSQIEGDDGKWQPFMTSHHYRVN